MRGYKNQIGLIDPKLILTLEVDAQNNTIFSIHEATSRSCFSLKDFDKVMNILEDLGSLKDFKEKEKKIQLNEFLSFQKVFVGDRSKTHEFEFRITDIKNGSVHIEGPEKLNLVKKSLMKLHDRYLSDKELDEKIKSEGNKYVEYDGKKFEVRSGTLGIINQGIKKITDIKGLENLTYLTFLDLSDNNIEEIEGLDQLVNLRRLHLHSNYIKEIKGLENLKNLEYLSLGENPITEFSGLKNLDNLVGLNLYRTKIPPEIFKEAGIKDPGHAKDLIKFLKIKEGKERGYKEIKSKTIEYIKQASSIFEELAFSKIISKTGIKIADLEEIVEELIFSGQIKAKIAKDAIVFIEESPLIDITLEAVDVLRGIKDDTESISLYTSYIEDVFDKIEDVEDYLKTHLASEYEKIKNAWYDYKNGKISRTELIKIGLKEIGKKFLKIFIQKV